MNEIIDSQKRHAFSGWPMIILWAGILVFSFHACTHMVAAGDTWVALACGRHFSNHGVNTVEPFSANSHKAGPTAETMSAYARQLRLASTGKTGLKANLANWWADKADNFEQWPQWCKSFAKWIHPTGWINQNWGTHYLFFWLAKTFGSEGNYNYDALIYWKFAVTLISAIAIYYVARIIGTGPLLSATAACFAPFVGRTFIDVRPAVFSNMLTPIFILVLVLATYRNIWYIWLVVPIAVFWCNVHGGYLYVFMILLPFMALHFITIPFSRQFITLGKRGVLHTIAASAATLIAVIAFNPFHLTNLTHTFIITLSENAKSWRTVNEWHPAFEWKNPVGQETAFLVMYIIAWVALVLWVFTRFLKPGRPDRRPKKNEQAPSDEYQWPKIDLPLITITAFTIYMAVRSRRFIPIAASAGCPVIALFVQQAIWAIAARTQLLRKQKFSVPAMPGIIRTSLLVISAGAVLFFGYYWGAKFKQVYLDPWPVDGKYDSVFMRMTASNVKPTDIGRFIRENKISGKMFNYWTEGGAIAFAQDPDPETGRTPLRLFMDGRAQAAYDHDKFQLWNYIKGGGPVAQNARFAKRGLTTKDHNKIAKWLAKQMQKYNVWVVVMPANELNSTFVKALKLNQNWVTVYADTYQRMFVDTNTAKGKALLNDILNKKVKFPNELSMNLTLGNILIGATDAKWAKVGFEHLKKAFQIRPTQLSTIELVYASRRKGFAKEVEAETKRYFDHFTENKDTLSKEGGYEKKLISAIMTGKFLRPRIKRTDPELSKQYGKLVKQYEAEHKQISKSSRW
ncbi:MAG: hypothetical protein ACYTFK_05970 [Planctomycetota bacterium]|jgi:hypothetical protein